MHQKKSVLNYFQALAIQMYLLITQHKMIQPYHESSICLQHKNRMFKNGLCVRAQYGKTIVYDDL